MGTKTASKEKGESRPDADEGKPAAADGGAPLFPTASSDWIAVQVERLDPVEEEGFLGRLPITATEEQIRGRWGGGRFMCRAVNGQNQFKQNRTVSIAGDPVFISEVNRLRWIRGQGRPGDNAAAVSAAAAAAPQAFGVAEIIALFQGMQQTQAQQQQQWAQQAAEERRAREEADRRREEQRREEERRREDQRRAEDKEREERRAREDEQARQRDREFMSTTINLVTSKQGGEAGQMQAFLTGMSAAIKMANAGGAARGDDDDEDEEPADPIAETVRGVIKGLGDTFIPGARAAGGAAPPAGAPPAPAAAPGEPEPVTIRGPLAAQLGELVTEAKAKGRNPEAVIAGGVDVLLKNLRKVPSANGAGVSAAMNAVKAGEGAKPAAS